MGILILIDHLHRHEAVAGIGERDGHRPRVVVEHRPRIESVAVGTYDRRVGQIQLAAVREVADVTAFEDPLAKVHIGLGAIEVVGGDRDGTACWRLRNSLRLGERGKADGGKQHASNFSKWNADRTGFDLKDFGAPPLIHYPGFYRAHDSLPLQSLLNDSFGNDKGRSPR